MNNLRIYLLFFLFSFISILQAQTYQIGVANFSFSDPARNNRNVFGEIHYPANTAGTNVAIASGQFPVIIFGHGFATNIDQYDGVYSEGLVREGYIIVYPETEGGLFGVDHADFGDDLSFLVDTYLAENNNSGSFFFQTMNGKTAVMGHSMGGGCSFLAAAQNSNVTAHASLAAAETSTSAIAAAANITVPSLVIAGAEDCVAGTATNQTLMYNDLDSYYKAYVEITGANHCNFGEAAAFSNCVTGEAFSGCGNPVIPKADQHTYTINTLKPFYNYWLKEDCTGWDTFQNYLTTSSNHTYLQERTQPIVSAITGSTATITFPALPGATSYTVIATDQGTMTSATASASTNSVMLTGLLPNSTYNYTVTTDCGMESPFSIDCTDPNTNCNMTDTFMTMAGCAPMVNLNGGISSGMYNASIQITADGTVTSPDNVILQAGTCIEMNNGFEVQLGAEFLAEIVGCL